MKLRDIFLKPGADMSWATAKAQVEAKKAAKAAENAESAAKAQAAGEKTALAQRAISRVATNQEKRAAYLELVALVGEPEADRLVAQQRRIKTRVNRR